MTAPTLAGDVLYVGTSWKMNKTLDQTREFFDELGYWDGGGDVQAFVLPALTSLPEAVDRVRDGIDVWVGAQNGHFEDAGAFTGEVSMAQLADAGATVVEIGHAERRAMFGEDDESIALKVRAALDAGLTPVVCVGEPRPVREQGGYVDFVKGQALQALSGVSADDAGKVLLAYEPVWAIGASGEAATAESVSDVISALAERWPATPVLYGGSVTPSNAPSFLELPDCRGIFVGRAAWQAQGLLELLDIARRIARARKENGLSI